MFHLFKGWVQVMGAPDLVQDEVIRQLVQTVRMGALEIQ